MHSIRVSVVIVACNMARELPRTLRSLSPSMQRGVAEGDCELIVVDNGSRPPVSIASPGWPLHLVRIEDASPSPAKAINIGVAQASGDLVGVMIDGARMASPGLLAGALMARGLHTRPVISTLGFHLGPDLQSRSVLSGYNQEQEDRLLDGSRWEKDGYRLFDISVFAGSSPNGWFNPINESNALFMPRQLWEEIGGYEEKFRSPGGGLVNLDTYARSCALPGSQLIVLLGEGTFHQFHGGVATNATTSPWQDFHDEYVRIRGYPFQTPTVEPIYLGGVNPSVLKSIEWSASFARRKCAQEAGLAPSPRPSKSRRPRPLAWLRNWIRS